MYRNKNKNKNTPHTIKKPNKQLKTEIGLSWVSIKMSGNLVLNGIDWLFSVFIYPNCFCLSLSVFVLNHSLFEVLLGSFIKTVVICSEVKEIARHWFGGSFYK